MTMTTLCKKVRGLRKTAKKVAAKYGVSIQLDNIYDENGKPTDPNIIFGYASDKAEDHNKAFDEIEAVLNGQGFYMSFECYGDGDNEILESHRVK